MFSHRRTGAAAGSRRWLAVAGVVLCAALGTTATVDAGGGVSTSGSGWCEDNYNGEMFWDCAATMTTDVTPVVATVPAIVTVSANVGTKPCPPAGSSVGFTVTYQDASGGFQAYGTVPYGSASGEYCETDYAAAGVSLQLRDRTGAYTSVDEVCAFHVYGTGNLTPPTVLEPVVLRVDNGTGCTLSNS